MDEQERGLKAIRVVPIETGESLIRVSQLPIIEEHLRTSVKSNWEQRERDAESMVCTAATLQAVKSVRADTTKEFELIEETRKAALAPIMERISEFNQIYKECVTEPYKRGDAIYKSKIAEVESGIKQQCEKRCRDFFSEYAAVQGISDFIRYEDAGIKIDMASAKQKEPKKLLQKIRAFVDKTREDVDAITKLDDAPEILDEYRHCLNFSQALCTVQERKKRIEAERTRQEERERILQRQEEAAKQVESAIQEEAILAPPVEVKSFTPITVAFRFELSTQKQFDAVKPIMSALLQTLKQEGIKYE